MQPVVQRESSVAVSLDRLGLGTRMPQIVVLEAAGSSPVSHPTEASFAIAAIEAFSLEFPGYCDHRMHDRKSEIHRIRD